MILLLFLENIGSKDSKEIFSKIRGVYSILLFMQKKKLHRRCLTVF